MTGKASRSHSEPQKGLRMALIELSQLTSILGRLLVPLAQSCVKHDLCCQIKARARSQKRLTNLL